MSVRTLYRILVASLAILFLSAQGGALAHAAEYGPDHSHDGVVCDIGIIAEDIAVLDDPQPRPTLSFQTYPTDYVSVLPPNPLTQTAPRGPPPRGPPTRFTN